MIAIDSKFPLENYQIMVDKNYDKLIREKAEKLFKSDMKKHIDAISSKYIIPGITSNQAICKDVNGIKELVIHTLEGDMIAVPGSYVVIGPHDEAYPVRGDIFEETYEETA